MDVAAERVRALLGGPDHAWLVDRAVDRWSRGQRLGETLRLADATPAQHEAMAALLGRRVRSSGALTVRVGDVEAVLRAAGAAPDLRAAVVALRGEVPDVAGARAAETGAWAAAYGPLDALAAARPGLCGWVDRVRGTGTLRRLASSPAEATGLAESAALVVSALPLPRTELRGHLANRLLGDAHALDDGEPVTTLVLGAASGLVPPGAEHLDGQAGSRRRVWESVGVAVGGLSAPVLTLGLPGDTTSATGRALALWHEAGQPVHLTLRQVVTSPPVLPVAGRDVFVCENPSVVEHVADALDGAGVAAPLVCTHGQPSAAVGALLDLLIAAGARLHHHGDFDWGGLRIAARVMRTWGARPWRMSAADYDAAVDAGRGGRALDGAPATSPWDPSLAQRMAATGTVVEEEALVDGLMADLDCG